jgi:hypothetical protein
MKELIEEYLGNYTSFRERTNKNKWLGGIVLCRRYNVELDDKTKDLMGDIVADILNGDRLWRKAMEEHPEWRGTDYEDKDALEEVAKKELGY